MLSSGRGALGVAGLQGLCRWTGSDGPAVASRTPAGSVLGHRGGRSEMGEW